MAIDKRVSRATAIVHVDFELSLCVISILDVQ